MIEYIFERDQRFTEADYNNYLTGLSIPTELFKGECATCNASFKIRPLPFSRVDNATKFPTIHCPYCGHHDYYHNFFSSDVPTLSMDTNHQCKCGLSYSVNGITAICPNCVIFNSREFLMSEIDKIKRDVSNTHDWNQLGDCLSKLVSLVDGYGRATIRFQFLGKNIPKSVKVISFQNLEGANQNIAAEFGVTIKAFVQPSQWALIYKYFQKRHLLAHALGVVDEDYIIKTGDTTVKIGRRTGLDKMELLACCDIAQEIGMKLYAYLAS